MQHYQFSNIEINDQFVSASVYKNNHYIFKIEADLLRLEYNKGIEDILYKEFRDFALDYLYYGDLIHDVSAYSNNMPALHAPDLDLIWEYIYN